MSPDCCQQDFDPEDREKMGLPKTRKQRRIEARARRKAERREAWANRAPAPQTDRGEG